MLETICIRIRLSLRARFLFARTPQVHNFTHVLRCKPMPSDGKCYRFRTKPFFPYVCERIRAIFASPVSSAAR